MKIIALSDIHGSYEKSISLVKAEWPWDGLIIAGDLTTLGTDEEARTALDAFLEFGAPVAAVCGNMDPSRLDGVLQNKGVSVSGRGCVWGEVGVFGVSGSPPTPMNTPHEIPERVIEEQALAGWEQVRDAGVKIFVPHAPPYGTIVDRLRSGQHVGSTAVRMVIESKHPALTICGHIHEARGIDSIGSTKIVNCGPAGRGYYVVVRLDGSIIVEMKG